MRVRWSLVLISAVLAHGVVGCEKQKTNRDAVSKTAGTAKQSAEAPAEEPVRLTIAFEPGIEGADGSARKAFADAVAKRTGFEIKVGAQDSHGAIIDGMRSKTVQVAYLGAWPFLRAHMTADADLLVAAEQDGKLGTDSNWYVATDNEKIQKLGDLRNKRVAFTSPDSASGFLFPYAKLIQEGVVKQGEDLNKAFGNVYFAGSGDVALKTLASGQVDAAAASAEDLAKLSPEDRAKVRALSTQGPAPTPVFAVRADMKPEVREKLKTALLAMGQPENVATLQTALGVDKLVERSHGDHIMGLQTAQETVGAEFPLRPTKGSESAP